MFSEKAVLHIYENNFSYPHSLGKDFFYSLKYKNPSEDYVFSGHISWHDRSESGSLYTVPPYSISITRVTSIPGKKIKNQNSKLATTSHFPHKTRNIAQIANRRHTLDLCYNCTEHKPASKQASHTSQTSFNLLPCKSCWLTMFTQKLHSKPATSVHLV